LCDEALPGGPVSRHTACTVGDVIVVHTFRGVMVVHSDGSVTEQETTGDAPEGVSMCAAVSLGDSRMVVYGGSTKTQELSPHVFLLDTKSWEWTKLKVAGSLVPEARASPGAALVPGTDDCVAVFGGACLGSGGYEGGAGLVAQDETWLMRVTDKDVTWESIATDKHPEARLANTLSPFQDGLVLQGGWDPVKGTYGEPWMLRP